MFYPRDSMLCSMLIAHCLCVCLSQIQCSVKTAEQIEVVLALRLSSTSPTPCKRKFQHLQKNKGASLRTLSQTPDLQNLLHGTSLSTKLIHGRVLLTTLATADAPSLDRFVYVLYTYRAHSLLHVRRFVTQNIARESDARSVCVSGLFLS